MNLRKATLKQLKKKLKQLEHDNSTSNRIFHIKNQIKLKEVKGV